MKPTKTLIKTFSKIMTALNKSNKVENFIYNRLHHYLDMMQANQSNRGFIKYIMYDLLDFSPDARDLFLNLDAIDNNYFWTEIKNVITK